MHRERIVDLEERVNRRNTKLWFMMNENSRSHLHREQFVKDNGGLFYQNDRGEWMWKNDYVVKNGYWLKRKDTGEKVFFENMSEFCRKNDLSIVKICEIMNGKRKSYKGWEPVEIRPVKDGPGSHKNVGSNPANNKKYEVVTQTAIFKNWLTNEIVLVNNIPEFAKRINGQKKELYLVAQGKKKSYKEWTLATASVPPANLTKNNPSKKES
jgi:hypothetical protein